MTRFLIFSVIALTVFSMQPASLASDPLSEQDSTENTEYAYGTVSAIDLSAGTIVIKEQNYDDDTETNITYYFSPDTAFENIDSLSEIKIGNDVDISYLVKDDGKKTIKFISVYKPEIEGEEE